MDKENTVIGTSTDMIWEQLHSIEDLNTVSEFFTPRQTACLLLAQNTEGILLQMLLTDGYTNELATSNSYQTTQYAKWLDEHFSKTDDETLMKCAYVAAMGNTDEEV